MNLARPGEATAPRRLIPLDDVGKGFAGDRR
jgi:hypothetical protein